MKKLVVILAVLVSILIIADFGTAAAAEHQVSQRIRTQLKLADDPAVRINGFPFITQALAGDYHNIEVKAAGVPVAGLRDVDVEATLNHVRVPLSDLLSDSARQVHIDEVIGRVKLSAADVGQLINIVDLKIDQAHPDELLERSPTGELIKSENPTITTEKSAPVKLSGSTDIAGTHTQVTVIGILALVENQIEISPKILKVSNQAGDVPLSPNVDRLIRKAFTARIDPGALPFTVIPTAVRAESGALVVEGTAKNIQLGASSVQNRGE